MSRRDVLDGFVPRRPPAELRARVLAVAREAERADRGLLEMLVRDRALRWCATIVLALAVANAIAGGKRPVLRALEAAPATAGDDATLSATARASEDEQARLLAPEFGWSLPR